MTTIEWTIKKLTNDIKKNMPSAEKDTLLLKMMIRIMGGNPDKHISMIVHESFHAFQAGKNFNRIKESESTFKQGKNYPWNDERFNKSWKEELNDMIKAYEAKDEKQAKQFIRQFLEKRNHRYMEWQFTAELKRFEQLREWEEGLAKYIELALWKKASVSSTYIPVEEIGNNTSFDRYKKFNETFSRELVTYRMQPQGDETRFYYSGMMQAFLLDKFYPKWKKQAFKGDIFLDNLLSKLAG